MNSLFYSFGLNHLDFGLCLLSFLEAKEFMVYSYTNTLNAFAAKLLEDEAKKLSGIDSFQFSLALSSFFEILYIMLLTLFACVSMDEVLLVFQNQYCQLHTTRSWNFIGLPTIAKRRLKSNSDIIVALFDTGSSWLCSHFQFLLFALLYLM